MALTARDNRVSLFLNPACMAAKLEIIEIGILFESVIVN